MLVLAPTLLIKKETKAAISKRAHQVKRFLGYVAYSIILFIQGIFGTGVGSIALFALTLLLGSSKLEANATRRAVTAVMAPIALIGLISAGLVQFTFGLTGLVGAFIGTNIGTRIAVNKGEDWVGWVMAVPILVSGVVLLITA